MSLGLVVADAAGIYLAAESEGLQSKLISSKVHRLQNDPGFAIVVAGGLEHWRDVFASYTPQATLIDACNVIVGLINEFTGPKNQAFGRLCGYNGNQACCWRIDRIVGAQSTTWCQLPLNVVQVIGYELHAEPARLEAEARISNGELPPQALRSAIAARIPGEWVRDPIDSLTIARPTV